MIEGNLLHRTLFAYPYTAFSFKSGTAEDWLLYRLPYSAFYRSFISKAVVRFNLLYRIHGGTALFQSNKAALQRVVWYTSFGLALMQPVSIKKAGLRRIKRCILPSFRTYPTLLQIYEICPFKLCINGV